MSVPVIRTLLPILALALSNSAASADSHDSTGYQILVYNACPDEMRLAVRYLSPGQDWQSDYWWSLNPGEGKYLASGEQRLLHQAGLKKLYMYAETTDGRGYFNTDTRPEDYNLIKIQDRRYVFGRDVLGSYDGNTFNVTVNCDNY